MKVEADEDECLVDYGLYKNTHGKWYRGGWVTFSKEVNKFDTCLKQNPTKSDGSVLTCIVYGSIYHFAKDCPDSFDNYNKKKDENISLCSDIMKHFVWETLSTTVLDSGCTKNTYGETWLSCYLGTLGSADLKLVKTFKA